MKNRYQVPQRGEDPTEELIEFLNQNPRHWDGDDNGIILWAIPLGQPPYDDEAEYVTAFPGDWIVRGEDGIYRVERP